jgi:hypothetical protein
LGRLEDGHADTSKNNLDRVSYRNGTNRKVREDADRGRGDWRTRGRSNTEKQADKASSHEYDTPKWVSHRDDGRLLDRVGQLADQDAARRRQSS